MTEMLFLLEERRNALGAARIKKIQQGAHVGGYDVVDLTTQIIIVDKRIAELFAPHRLKHLEQKLRDENERLTTCRLNFNACEERILKLKLQIAKIVSEPS